MDKEEKKWATYKELCAPNDWEITRYKKMEKIRETSKPQDPVNHPTHYQVDIKGQRFEVLDLIKASLSKEEFIGFLKGNCIKYQLRSSRKNGSEDWKKSGFYNKVLKELYEEDDNMEIFED